MESSLLDLLRIIAKGGADSLSKMPDYSDSMSIRLVDLVAYLDSRP